jgi:hypothetical protein
MVVYGTYIIIFIVSCIVFLSPKGNRARHIGNIISVAIFLATVFVFITFGDIYKFALRYIGTLATRTKRMTSDRKRRTSSLY